MCRLRNQKGRPPASPQLRPRRVAQIASQQQPPLPPKAPSRTHSLDDILDREGVVRDEAAVVSACEKYLSATELSAPSERRAAPPLQRGLSCDAAAEAPTQNPAGRSDSAFSLDEPKRKRNFMDKCVNKVRSFIKK